MSRIGRIPIEIKEGVSVNLQGNKVSIVGLKGSLSYEFPQGIEVKIDDGKVVVSLKKGEDVSKAMYGLARMTIANMIKGISTGFEKKLELSGVGYRAQMQGEDLLLSLGFSHPVLFKKTEGIKFSVADNAIIISGIDNALVGNIAAKIRAVRPPEPYKGKGIKYSGERIRRKAGKAAKAVGGK